MTTTEHERRRRRRRRSRRMVLPAPKDSMPVWIVFFGFVAVAAVWCLWILTPEGWDRWWQELIGPAIGGP